MLAAASTGFMTAFFTGSWIMGFVVGALTGALFGFLLALLHERYRVNQFILGICLVILGSGAADLLYKIVMGVRLDAPKAPPTPILSVPFLSGIPLLSALFSANAIVWLMYALSLAAWWFFYRTQMGLETRAIGESPRSADVAGINVKLTRYLATTVGSALIGLAGAYIPLVVTETYAPDISAGRGFMAVGIAIFASWKPHRAIIGGLLFSAIEVLSFQLQMLSSPVPYQFFLMLPFFAVLAVMMIFRKTIEYPASIGKPYSRE
ncbi:MAG: hypothetical protein A2Y36_00160 [Treponema sp. GWA1_62_8]|nr:MAG: hypothetical protein A2Y36_00160 [Treponema sp. GWA1_62_8]